MTREEALNKISIICRSVGQTTVDNINIELKHAMVNSLEALGLITFENKPPMIVRFNTKDYPSGLVIMVDGKVILP